MFSLRGSLARCSTSFWLGQAANVSPPSFPAPHGSSTNLKGQKHTGFPLLQQTAERNQQFSIHKLSFILLGFTPFPNTPASFYYSRAGAWGTRVRAAQLSVLNLQLFDLLSIHQKLSYSAITKSQPAFWCLSALIFETKWYQIPSARWGSCKSASAVSPRIG